MSSPVETGRRGSRSRLPHAMKEPMRTRTVRMGSRAAGSGSEVRSVTHGSETRQRDRKPQGARSRPGMTWLRERRARRRTTRPKQAASSGNDLSRRSPSSGYPRAGPGGSSRTRSPRCARRRSPPAKPRPGFPPGEVGPSLVEGRSLIGHSGRKSNRRIGNLEVRNSGRGWNP